MLRLDKYMFPQLILMGKVAGGKLKTYKSGLGLLVPPNYLASPEVGTNMLS